MYIIAHPLLALAGIANSLIFVYSALILAAVVLSFVSPDPRNPLVRFIATVTEPALSRVRRYVPPIGNMDLSPLVLLIGLEFIRQGVLPIIQDFARSLL